MTDRMFVIPRKKRRVRNTTQNKKSVYGLEVIGDSRAYPLPAERLICNLPPTLRAELNSISSAASYRKGEILFAEGETARGVFLIHEGRVKLSADSPDGKSLILRMAVAGDIVGLPGTISGKAYETTSTALETVRANFIPRMAFRDFVRAHGEVGLRVAEALSDIYHVTYRELRYLGLSGSAEGKLARFLLDWGANHNGNHRPAQTTPLTPTHEQIAEMVGASRETVSRLLAEFRRKGLVELRGSNLLIVNEAAIWRLLT